MTAEPNRIHLVTVAFVDTTTTLLITIILIDTFSITISDTFYYVICLTNKKNTCACVLPMTAGLLFLQVKTLEMKALFSSLILLWVQVIFFPSALG